MTDWITHNSTEPPELAPAALVEIKASPTGVGIPFQVQEYVGWFPGLEYRVLRNPDGHPYVSAEGLHSEVKWVFVTKDGECIQSLEQPEPWHHGEGWIGWALGLDAPSTHKHPGDWRDSLCAVWREE